MPATKHISTLSRSLVLMPGHRCRPASDPVDDSMSNRRV